jgi:hypothetical protein
MAPLQAIKDNGELIFQFFYVSVRRESGPHSILEILIIFPFSGLLLTVTAPGSIEGSAVYDGYSNFQAGALCIEVIWKL